MSSQYSWIGKPITRSPAASRRADQVGHVEALRRRDLRQRRSLDQVDAGVDEALDDRLLEDRGDRDALALDDAVGNRHPVVAQRHRHRRPVLAVEVQHGAEIDLGEDVAVDHQHRLVGGGDGLERPRRPQRLVLVDIADVHAEAGAVAEVVGDHRGLVVGGDVEVADAGLLELVDDQLQQRPVAHRQHRLGQVGGQRAQAGAESARHHHGRHRRLVLAQQVAEQRQPGHATGGVEERDLAHRVLVHQAQQSGVGAAGGGGHRRRPGVERRPLEQIAHRQVDVDVGEDGAPDVAVGEGAEQAPLVVDDQRDPGRAAVDDGDGVAHRLPGTDQRQLVGVVAQSASSRR